MHTEPLLKNLSIFKIQDILLQTLKMYHKHRNNKLHTIDHYMQIKKYTTTIHAKQMSYTHRALHKFAEKCIRYNLIRVVNNSPHCILNKLNTHSLTDFANYAKQIFIQKYQDNCTIQNCYTCLSINNTNTHTHTHTCKLLKSIYMSLKHIQYPLHCFKHTTKYGHTYIHIYIYTHTYMSKYIETHNTHIMYAHNCYCIHSCTLIDYHHYFAQISTFLHRGRIYYI